MIFIGLGANLPSIAGPPRKTIEAALDRLARDEIAVAAISRFYESPPFPPSDQPWFVNAVARLETTLDPAQLLTRLHAIEQSFGRSRTVKNEARVLDLDLLAYGDLVRENSPTLPHPRLSDRGFVLLPLRDVASDWMHPQTGETISALIARLPDDQKAAALP